MEVTPAWKSDHLGLSLCVFLRPVAVHTALLFCSQTRSSELHRKFYTLFTGYSYFFNWYENIFNNFILYLWEAMLTDEAHEVDKIYSSKIEKETKLQTNT